MEKVRSGIRFKSRDLYHWATQKHQSFIFGLFALIYLLLKIRFFIDALLFCTPIHTRYNQLSDISLTYQEDDLCAFSNFERPTTYCPVSSAHSSFHLFPRSNTELFLCNSSSLLIENAIRFHLKSMTSLRAFKVILQEVMQTCMLC